MVSEGLLEAALVTLPIPQHDLFVQKVCTEKVFVCLRRDDPLAGFPALPQNAIADRLTVLFARVHHPMYYDKIMHKLGKAGILLRPTAFVSAASEMQYLVSKNRGFGLVTESTVLRPELIARPVEGLPLKITTAFICLRAQQRPVLQLLAYRLSKRCVSEGKMDGRKKPSGNVSGYAPFNFDVTDYVKYGGSNVITVRVDATLNEGWYYEGAGIYRHTWLTKKHPLHIAQWGTFVQSDIRQDAAHLSIQTELVNDSVEKASGRLLSRIMNPAGKFVATVPATGFEIAPWASATLHTQASLPNPALWSLENPSLYRVESAIESGGKVTDHDDVTFGIRSIRFDPDHGFFLNGKSVKLKGTCNHQDHAGVGIAVPDRIHSDRVAVMKQMGSNAWRTAHNPVATEFFDACDRQGMMVMAEVRSMASTPEGLSQLERMIRKDRNHPSIVIWSLANEEYFYQGTSTGARIVSSMKRLAKKLDPSRPVTGAMNGGWGRGMSAVVDVQGFNYWNGGMPGEKGGPKGRSRSADIDDFHQNFPKLPTVGTEVSNASSTRGIYENDPNAGYVTAFGLKSPSVTDAEQWWAIFDARPFLSGGFTWVGIDYRGEPNPFDHVTVSSQSGIVDTCGFPKDVYHYYKSWWGSEPVLHLFPHWNWDGREGEELQVRCHSNLDSIELFLNGTGLGSQNVPRNSHVGWPVKYAPGVLEARGSKGGRVVLTERRETTGAASQLILRPSLNQISADGQDCSAIAVEIQDAQGRAVPTACPELHFKITGPGKIIGMGNGNPSCRERDKPESQDFAVRSAFNGLCMAFIQATKQPGTIRLEVSGRNLTSAQVEVRSVAAQASPTVA